MGKRKRRADKNKAPSHLDILLHAPQVDLQSKQGLHMDAPDSSLKRSPGRESPYHNHVSNHRVLLRHSRHSFDRHYSKRSSSSYSDASPSNWKGSPLYDTKLSFKSESKDLSAFRYRGSKIFQKLERIRSSSVGEDSVSGDVRNMECRLCQKHLRKSPFIFASSSTDLSVVAVLVCGHIYHADCLEQRTSHEDRQDPPCPLCVNQTTFAA